MESNIIFSESQKFRQWWIWVIMIAVNLLCLFGLYRQVILQKPIGPRPASNLELLIPVGLTILITVLFYFLRLETVIKNDGIYIRFFPFHFTRKFYSWESLSKSFVRKYSPIVEYGGWGIRFGVFGKGVAYNVSGNKGLQLVFTNDKRILIGTNKPDELTDALIKTYHYKE